MVGTRHGLRLAPRSDTLGAPRYARLMWSTPTSRAARKRDLRRVADEALRDLARLDAAEMEPELPLEWVEPYDTSWLQGSFDFARDDYHMMRT